MTRSSREIDILYMKRVPEAGKVPEAVLAWLNGTTWWTSRKVGFFPEQLEIQAL